MSAEKTKSRLTLEQRIARQEVALARLRAQKVQRSRKLDTREKIIVGGTVLAAMREDADLRARVVQLLKSNVTRELDREVVAEWLATT